MLINFTDRFLALPFANQPTRLALLVHMILRADECGIVRQTVDELVVCTGIPHPTIKASIEQFQEHKLIIATEPIQFPDNTPYWKHQVKIPRKPRSTASGQTTSTHVHSTVILDGATPAVHGASATTVPDASPSGTPLPQREAAFKARFAIELERWKERKPDWVFPKEEQEAFCEYWTTPTKNNTKLYFEDQKVFDIQRRMTTWMTGKQARYRREAARQQATLPADTREQTMLDNIQYIDQQRAEYERSKASIPPGYTPLTWYQELKRRAANGDQAAINELHLQQ